MKRWLESSVVVEHRGHMSESMICLRARLTPVLRRSLKSSQEFFLILHGALEHHMRGAKGIIFRPGHEGVVDFLVVNLFPISRKSSKP